MKPLIAFIFLALSSGAATADCAAAREEWNAQMAITPVPDLIRMARGLEARGCPPEVVRTALQATSSVAARRASSLLQSGEPREAEALLDIAPLMHWEVLAMRGLLASRNGDFDAAARAYNLAIDTLGAPDVTGQSPALEPAVPRLVSLAQEAMLAAGSTRASIRMDGSVTGVMRAVALGLGGGPQPAGYNVVASGAASLDRLVLPLEFEPGSAGLSRAGEAEARVIAGFLRGLPSELGLRIVGHTEAEGSSLENRILSLERAETLRRFFQGRGVGAFIRVDGRGGEDPPQLSDPAIYTIDQKRAMARRIEVIFENG